MRKFITLTVVAALAFAFAQEKAADDADKEAPALNWDAAPVDIVLQTYGEQVDKTVIKDPAVPNAQITLKSREGKKLTRAEYLEAIEVVLEMNGVHLEPYGESFIRAIPRKDARKEGIPLYMDPETIPADTPAGKVISVMIQLKNIGTDEAQKALEGFKSASGILLVFERTASILVTDTKQNIDRMLEISRAIDVATPVTEQVFVYQVENASATDIKTVLESIVQESQKELEKEGKGAANATARPSPFVPNSPTSLLRRTNTSPAPAAPANESLVMSVSDADRGMIRGKVVIIADERSNKLVIITSKANYDFFERVIKSLDVETTPDTVVKVYRLKYADAEEVSDMINDLIGNASSSKSSAKSNQNQAARGTAGGGNLTRNSTTTARKSVNQRTGEAKAGELSKENTTVLADKRINGLVVMTNKELVPVVEQIVESMDIKLAQVLIETVIVEVSLGDDLRTGIDWVQRGKHSVVNTIQSPVTGPNGLNMYNYTDGEGNVRQFEDVGGSFTDDSGTWTQLGQVFNTITSKGTVRDDFVNHGNYMLGGGGGMGSDMLRTMMSVGTNIVGSAIWGGANPIGSGISYLLKSDKLNLAAVIEASKTDSRTKYLASPVVMTVDNKEATINATKLQYLLKGFQTSGSSYFTMAVPDYEQKEIGIEIKVTPKINPNGTVMLEVEEKYSQVSGSQTIQTPSGSSSSSAGGLMDVVVPTTVTREMSADVLLENMQTVVFGGLTETYTSEEETGIPLLKDIPWIGKWLFGSVKQTESRSELLLFMTPYVLDDADAAQAEAIRRKKALSDPRPWEDHGWSLSELADPVSKKEQIRRLKDEWAKQDEERKTKLAIEKMKIDRVKKLKEMSEDERKMWLKMHKEELEDEEREELERKMEDPESQEELRALVEKIRREKLGEANEAIRENEALTHAENERGKLEAEKNAATNAVTNEAAEKSE